MKKIIYFVSFILLCIIIFYIAYIIYQPLEKFDIFLLQSWGFPTYFFKVTSPNEIEIFEGESDLRIGKNEGKYYIVGVEKMRLNKIIKLSLKQRKEIKGLMRKVAKNEPIPQERMAYHLDATEIHAIIKGERYWSISAGSKLDEKNEDYYLIQFDVDMDLVNLFWSLADISPIPITR